MTSNSIMKTIVLHSRTHVFESNERRKTSGVDVAGDGHTLL